MTKIIYIFLIMLLFSCSTKQLINDNNKTIEITPAHSNSTDSVPQSKASIENLIKKFLGKPIQCPDYESLPKGKKCYRSNEWFEKVDNKNGYLKVAYLGDGYHEYFLFYGKNYDVVTLVNWACGPVCDQVVQFYKVVGDSLVELNYKNVLSKNLIKKLHLAKPKNNAFLTLPEDSVKNYLLKFPEKGTTLNVITVGDVQDETFIFSAQWDAELSQFY